MKAKHLLIPCVLMVVIAVLLWRRGDHSPAHTNANESKKSNTVPALALTTNQTINPFAHSAPVVQAAPQPEIELAQQWMSAARPLRCDPTVTNVVARTNRRTGHVTGFHIATPTHFIVVANRTDGPIVEVGMSHFDSDNTLPEHQAKWYECTAPTWTEQKATAETWAILERMGATDTFAQIASTNYEAIPLPLRTPSGGMVTNTPFVIVTFLNATGNHIVTAEYRMDPSGPGLVHWRHWPTWRGQR